MNAKTLLAGTSIALALAAAAATPANAVITTFAKIGALTTDNLYLKNASSTGKSQNFTLYTISTPTSTTPGSVNVEFSYINDGTLLDTAVSNITAKFTLNATEAGTPAISAGGFVIQPAISGSFSILATAPITIGTGSGRVTGTNLLSGTFGGAGIGGAQGTSSGSLSGDNEKPGETMTYTSDFLSFAHGADLDSSFSLTAIISTIRGITGLNVASGGSYALASFKADAGGSFSSDPTPHVIPSVPEPASWALMMVGFGIAGASIRRRARVQVAA